MVELDLDDADTAFVQSNTDWQITDVALPAHVHEIDSGLTHTCSAHEIRGSPLHLHYSSMVASRFLVTDALFNLSMVRGYTRLRHICWMLSENGAKQPFNLKSPRQF